MNRDRGRDVVIRDLIVRLADRGRLAAGVRVRLRGCANRTGSNSRMRSIRRGCLVRTPLGVGSAFELRVELGGVIPGRRVKPIWCGGNRRTGRGSSGVWVGCPGS